MLISCKFSVVGLHLLLLTHIAHSFVLLTANVEDVKKIARKFVSESLAEKIADFIARATETIAQNTKISEENENNADTEESSQVSAENRMYNVERHGFDSQAGEVKSKEEIVLGKVTVRVPKKEKKAHGFEGSDTTRKPRKEPNPLNGRSRYIVQTENKASLATEKVLPKSSNEDKYNKMKETIKLLEDTLFSTPHGKTKPKKQKKKIKVRAYKLLSGFASVENDAAKVGVPDNKVTKVDEPMFNVRAMDDDRVSSLPTEKATTGIEQHDSENVKQTEKAVPNVTQLEIKLDKNTELVPTNKPSHSTEKDEFDHDENKIIQKNDKLATSGSPSIVTKRDGKEENWWEKELPTPNHEVITKRKSWF